MKHWLRKLLGMQKVVEPRSEQIDWDQAFRRYQVMHHQDHRAHQASKNRLTATGEMTIIQRRIERDSRNSNLPKVEV